MEQYKSRKWQFAVVAAGVAFANAYWELNLSSDEVWQIVAPLMLYVSVEGVRDLAQTIFGREVKPEATE